MRVQLDQAQSKNELYKILSGIGIQVGNHGVEIGLLQEGHAQHGAEIGRLQDGQAQLQEGQQKQERKMNSVLRTLKKKGMRLSLGSKSSSSSGKSTISYHIAEINNWNHF